MNPCILHLDLDAFFASVEQIRNPSLRGKPVIVGSGCIASCSYEARRFGLTAGMSIREAMRLCPRALVLKGDQRVYHAFAERVFEACRGVSPAVETYLDEAHCDLTGTSRINGSPLEAGSRLKVLIQERTGLTVTVGIGTNRMIARLAGKAAKPDGLAAVEPGSEASFIADRPVRELPGVGRRTGELFSKLNIETVADLRAVPRPALRQLLGEPGEVLYERCRGRDPRAVSQREVPRSVSRETAFHYPTAAESEIEAMLYYLTERAARFLRGRGLEARTVGVRIRYSDFRGAAASATLAAPTALDPTLFHTAARLLRSLRSRRVSLRLVGLRLEGLRLAEATQGDLMEEDAEAARRQLVAGLDRVRSRYGHSAVVVGRSIRLLGALEQNPDGFVLRTPSLTK